MPTVKSDFEKTLQELIRSIQDVPAHISRAISPLLQQNNNSLDALMRKEELNELKKNNQLLRELGNSLRGGGRGPGFLSRTLSDAAGTALGIKASGYGSSGSGYTTGKISGTGGYSGEGRPPARTKRPGEIVRDPSGQAIKTDAIGNSLEKGILRPGLDYNLLFEHLDVDAMHSQTLSAASAKNGGKPLNAKQKIKALQTHHSNLRILQDDLAYNAAGGGIGGMQNALGIPAIGGGGGGGGGAAAAVAGGEGAAAGGAGVLATIAGLAKANPYTAISYAITAGIKFGFEGAAKASPSIAAGTQYQFDRFQAGVGENLGFVYALNKIGQVMDKLNDSIGFAQLNNAQYRSFEEVRDAVQIKALSGSVYTTKRSDWV